MAGRPALRGQQVTADRAAAAIHRRETTPAPEPTTKLKVPEMKIWRQIVATRAPEEWQGVDTALATDLCMCLVQVGKLTRQLHDEGHVLKTSQGTFYPHPLVAITSKLWLRIFNLQTRLNLSPSTNEQRSGVVDRRQTAKTAESVSKRQADSKGLLPRFGPQEAA